MKTDEISDLIAEQNENALLADGFEGALIGYVQVFSNVVALYDRDKCLEILVKRDGMSGEEAVEYFDFNVVGAYAGEGTPAFATILRTADRKRS